MDVREWLHGLGLGQYGQKFRDNKIDVDVLADLTDGDIEKLGIPLGDRVIDRRSFGRRRVAILRVQTASRHNGSANRHFGSCREALGLRR